MIGTDLYRLIGTDGFHSVVRYLQGLVMTDALVFVVQDLDLPILLTVQIYLFLAFHILETNLVESSASPGGVRLKRALCLMLRKRVRGSI